MKRKQEEDYHRDLYKLIVPVTSFVTTSRFVIVPRVLRGYLCPVIPTATNRLNMRQILLYPDLWSVSFII